LPLYHEVFDGNQPELPTLMPKLKKVLSRFGHIKRLIVVANRGLLSLDNIDELGKIKLPSGQALEFILAVPGRRYGEFVEVLQDFQGRAATVEQEIVEETSWHDLRLVVAHHPQRAKEQARLYHEVTSASNTTPARSISLRVRRCWVLAWMRQSASARALFGPKPR
jgi:transposase